FSVGRAIPGIYPARDPWVPFYGGSLPPCHPGCLKSGRLPAFTELGVEGSVPALDLIQGLQIRTG
ncbi:MAG TPA: hypothetical protein VJ508_12490, partial [Saprospiraceae bacterium]|nr:hypothetical protein [Saprospiraceae bacterium]